MISEINGRIKKKKESSVVMEVGGLCYEILIPPAVMKNLDTTKPLDAIYNLKIYYYFQMDQSKAIPVMVGFINDVEKDFFERFITVSGVGPKAACRALSLSFPVIADAIDRGDMALLRTLPGIGEQKAREIIAKLQGKVGKFCLMQDRASQSASDVKDDVKEEALNVLLQLQYKKPEAKEMIDKAVKRNPKAASCEEILNEVYKGSKSGK